MPRVGLRSAGLAAPNNPVPLDKPLKLGKVAEVVGLASVLVKLVVDEDKAKPVVLLVFEVAEDKLPPKLMLLPKPVAGAVVVAGLAAPPKLKPPKPVEAGAAVAVVVVERVAVVVPPKLNPPNPVEADAAVVVPPSLKPPRPVLAAGAAAVVVAAGAAVEAPKPEDVEPKPPKPVLAG